MGLRVGEEKRDKAGVGEETALVGFGVLGDSRAVSVSGVVFRRSPGYPRGGVRVGEEKKDKAGVGEEERDKAGVGGEKRDKAGVGEETALVGFGGLGDSRAVSVSGVVLRRSPGYPRVVLRFGEEKKDKAGVGEEKRDKAGVGEETALVGFGAP